MAHHVLKCVNPYFGLVFHCIKTFEVRKNDRNFASGDIVFLMEYDSNENVFTGRFVILEINYLFNNVALIGFDGNICVFNFTILFSYINYSPNYLES